MSKNEQGWRIVSQDQVKQAAENEEDDDEEELTDEQMAKMNQQSISNYLHTLAKQAEEPPFKKPKL